MVNFYDNYQQSKVMNLIPTSAKNLLKANKDQVEMDSKYYSMINDMADRANANFVSTEDSKEFAERSGMYIDAAKSVMSNKSLDADPVNKFRAIAKIHGDMLSDKRLQVLVESNKNMSSELKKMAPSLQGYFDRSVRPNLRSPNDGSVWSMNYDFNPEKDFESIMSEAKSVLKPTLIEGENNKPLKNPDGSYVTELSKASIDQWIDTNVDRLMSTRPGAVFSVADNIEKNMLANHPESGMTRIDFSDPIHSNTVRDEFKIALKNMFSEYSRQSIQGGKNTNFKFSIDNRPNMSDPIVPIDVLIGELDQRGLFDYAGSKFGAAQGTKFKYDLSDLSNKVKGKSMGYLPSDVVSTSTTDYADYIWKQGSNVGIITSQNGSKNNVVFEGIGAFTSSRTFGTKNYNIFPSLSGDAHIVSYKPTNTNGVVDKTKASGWAGNNIGNALKQLSDNKLLSLAETTSVTPDYIMLPNGKVGSIATVKIPDKGNSAIDSPIKYLFGNEIGGKIANSLSQRGDGSKYTLKINGGMDIVITYVDVPADKAPNGVADSYYTFDVAKPLGELTGPSAATMLYDYQATGGTGLTKKGIVTAGEQNWATKKSKGK